MVRPHRLTRLRVAAALERSKIPRRIILRERATNAARKLLRDPPLILDETERLAGLWRDGYEACKRDERLRRRGEPPSLGELDP